MGFFASGRILQYSSFPYSIVIDPLSHNVYDSGGSHSEHTTPLRDSIPIHIRQASTHRLAWILDSSVGSWVSSPRCKFEDCRGHPLVNTLGLGVICSELGLSYVVRGRGGLVESCARATNEVAYTEDAHDHLFGKFVGSSCR